MTMRDSSPERAGVQTDFPVGEPVHAPTEPPFTHVTPPSTEPTFGMYNDSAWNSESRSRAMPIGIGMGWVLLGIGGGLGGWLYLRWQRERNKPINRIRRQAMQAAGELRDRVPSSPEAAVRPAAGLTTALISILVILYQQAQARSRQAEKVASRQTRKVAKRADKAVGRASDAVSDVDWQKRLRSLKKRWDPSRLELERISI
jgi:hypothetical protein